MTLPDVHLAGEAVAAYADDALSPTARDRAERHMRSCEECRTVVEAQREAKVLLAAALDPELPSGLVARLRDIPMTADLGGNDIVYAVDGDQLAWARMPLPRQVPGELQFAGQPVGAGAAAAVAAPFSAPPWLSPVAVPAASAGMRSGPVGRRDTAERGNRPGSYPSFASAGPSMSRRRRRGLRLAGALAGLAFGMIASAGSTSPSGTALTGQVGGTPAGGQPVVNGSSVPGQLDVGTLRVNTRDQSRASLLGGTWSNP